VEENIIKVINYVCFWPKGISTLHYYNLIFTEKRIIWEYAESNPYVGSLGKGVGMVLLPFMIIGHYRKGIKIKTENLYNRAENKNIDKILENIKNFSIENWAIETVIIKKGLFKIIVMRKYPILGKKCKIRFYKQYQQDVEDIFMKMLPSKTVIKN